MNVARPVFMQRRDVAEFTTGRSINTMLRSAQAGHMAPQTGKNMGAIRFADCFKGAWRDALKLMRQRPLLVAALSVALFFLQFALDELHQPPRTSSLLALLSIIVLTLLKLGVMNVMAVKAMRYVLLGDADIAALAGRDFWRYFGITVGVALGALVCVTVATLIVAIVLPRIGIHAYSRALVVTSGVVSGLLALWISLRLCLLFCHVAIGRPLDARAAWRDSRGNVWRIVGFHLSLTLSLCVLVVPFGLLGSLLAFLLDSGSKAYAFGLSQALASGPMLLVLGAGSAWVYRRFAKALLPASPPSAPSFQSL
jgi:hypothetical protein